MTNAITSMLPDLDLAASDNTPAKNSAKSQAEKQADAENQREAWLRQMESNQIALLQQADPPGIGTASGASGKSLPQQAGRQRDSTRNETDSTRSEVNQVSLLPVHTIVPPQADASAVPVSEDRTAPAPEISLVSAMQTGARVAQKDTGLATASDTVAAAGAPPGSAAQLASNAFAAAGAGRSASLAATPQTDTLASPSQIAPVKQSFEQTGSIAAPQLMAVKQTQVATVARDTPSPQAAVLREPDAQGARLAGIIAPTVTAGLPPGIDAPTPAAQQVTPTGNSSVAAITSRAMLETTSAPAEETTEGEDAGEVEHGAPSGETDAAAGEEWQKNLVHLAQDGKNLSVSIRDASLDAGQTTLIVNRLAGDAAQAGFKLHSATVNGKTHLKLPKASGKGGESTTSTASASAAIERLSDGITDALSKTSFPLQNIHDIQE